MPTLYQFFAGKAGAPAKITMFPQRMLQSYCGEPRVACIDAAPAFTGAGITPEEAYLEQEYLHFSTKGHSMMVAYLWPQLESLLAELERNKSK